MKDSHENEWQWQVYILFCLYIGPIYSKVISQILLEVQTFIYWYESLGCPGENTWQNWFNVLMNVTVLEIRKRWGKNNGFTFAKPSFKISWGKQRMCLQVSGEHYLEEQYPKRAILVAGSVWCFDKKGTHG